MKILHLCYADGMGGAAVGARRLHLAMKSCNVNSQLLVVNKTTNDEHIIGMKRARGSTRLRHMFNQKISGLLTSENPVVRSLGVLPTGAHKVINSLGADIVQMHWINADTISISEIPKINAPVFWKLPDMWAFSGAEHYNLPDDPERYIEGYTSDNRPAHERGLDINKFIWKYKRAQWKNADFNIVGPSSWISECARKSSLLSGRSVKHILNPLDTDLYRPLEKSAVRKEFNLPLNKKLILFAAMYATSDKRKGFSHLKKALTYMKKYMSPEEVDFVVLGSTGPEDDKVSGYNLHYLGTIRDEERLVRAYNVADILVFPSTMDNLPNIIKEATCCGISCVGFNVGGMPDMINHKETGYLARPYDAEELACGIGWAVENSTDDTIDMVREIAVCKHKQRVVVERYMNFYNERITSG